MQRLRVVYEPKGEAREYAPLAVNLRVGCEHGCLYCYGPRAAHKKRDAFHSQVRTRENILANLQDDAVSLKGDDREILLSFLSDPYSPEEMTSCLTRQALEILIEDGLRFTILTKGGIRASRDFELLARYKKASFGSTLVLTSQKDADCWEPYAAPVRDRIKAVKLAHDKGIRTWISMEPVIDPAQAIQLVKELHPVVDHWKVGKLNYREEAHNVDWKLFRAKITRLLDSVGADYYVKTSLAKA